MTLQNHHRRVKHFLPASVDSKNISSRVCDTDEAISGGQSCSLLVLPSIYPQRFLVEPWQWMLHGCFDGKQMPEKRHVFIHSLTALPIETDCTLVHPSGGPGSSGIFSCAKNKKLFNQRTRQPKIERDASCTHDIYVYIVC